MPVSLGNNCPAMGCIVHKHAVVSNLQRRIEQLFPEFSTKRATSRGTPKFLKLPYRENLFI